MSYVDEYMRNVMKKCYLERVSEKQSGCPYDSFYLRQLYSGRNRIVQRHYVQ